MCWLRRMALARALALWRRWASARRCPNFLIYEYNQLFNPLRHSVINEAIDFHEGALHPGGGHGLSLSLNDAAVEKYRVDS